MAQYVAFLRGINSGRNRTLKMDILKKAFEGMGFKSVKTVLASGNVVFETKGKDKARLEQKIQKVLPALIGFESETIVLQMEDLKRIVSSNPFKNIDSRPNVKSYVTFIKSRANSIKFPIAGSGYTILGITSGVVCSIVDLSRAATPDLMAELDSEWKGNTTRAWETVLRIATADT